MTVNQILSDFLRYHREQNSRATVEFYEQGLAWFRRGFGSAEWAELDRTAVCDALFASWHKSDGSPLSDSTHRRNKVAIAQLQKHAVEQEFIDEKQTVLKAKDLKKPASGRRTAVPLAADLDAIFAAATPALRLALRGLRASGMRPGELCRADLGMIETKDGARVLVIREHKTAAKTGRARRIAIGPALATVIAEAAGDRTAGPIWLDDAGGRWAVDRISSRFRAIRGRLGISPAIVLYSVRHYVGTWAARECGLNAAKELLGHTSITMTQRYAHTDDSDQLAAQRAIEESEGRRAA